MSQPNHPATPAPYTDHAAPGKTPAKPRFSLLVQKCHPLPQGGAAAFGYVHGKISLHEQVHILDPQGNVHTATVELIKIEETKPAPSAKNQYILLHLKDLAANTAVGRLAVLTDLAPQSVQNSVTVPANPYLTGLLNEYSLLHQDPYYASILLYAVCHAHYMVPVQVSHSPFNVQTNNTAKSTDITFLSLKAEDGSRADFPLFTDMQSFEKWKTAFNEPLPKTVTVKFSHIASLTKENRHGLLINPFGPVSFPMPYDFVQHVTNMEQYRQEFAPASDSDTPEESDR